MSPKLNKVYLSGQVVEDPYEVPGRYRQFVRLRMALPKERNHRRNDPDTIVLEAAGRTGASLLLNVKKGQSLTVEGRLRSTILEQGDNRSVALLIRIESYSLHAELKDPPPEREGGSGGDEARGEARSGNSRRRGRRRRGRGPKGEAGSEAGPAGEGKPEGSAAAEASASPPPEAAAEAPSSAGAEAAADRAEAAPEASAPAKAAEAPKVEVAPAPKPEEPAIPRVQPSTDPSLKEDMPF